MGYLQDHQHLVEQETEARKAQQIHAVLRHFLRIDDMSDLTCLHLGCTGGEITKEISSSFKHTTGLDIDLESIQFAHSNYGTPDKTFLLGDAAALPFAAQTFDVVICNHIYNYVHFPEHMMAEIERVMTCNGCCYFAATQFAHDAAGYPTRNLDYFRLRKLLRNFDIKDYTINVLTAPQTFQMRMGGLLPNIARRLPRAILSLLLPIFPSFIFVLKRKNQ